MISNKVEYTITEVDPKFHIPMNALCVDCKHNCKINNKWRITNCQKLEDLKKVPVKNLPVTLREYKCRCGHFWFANINIKPIHCPKCYRENWDLHKEDSNNVGEKRISSQWPV